MKTSKSDFSKFERIADKIIVWDYSTVIGEAIYIKYSSDKFAHIKLKISVKNEQSSEKSIIWNVEQHEIPEQYRELYIADVLRDFNEYVNHLRKCSIVLHYEVIDGTYHPNESPLSFVTATVYAILNCFDKTVKLKDKKDYKLIIEKVKTLAKSEHQ